MRLGSRTSFATSTVGTPDRMEQIQRYFFDLAIMEKALPALLGGLVTTLWIALLVVVTGILAGLLLACLRAYRIMPLSVAIVAFADIFRSVPALALLIVVYFALPEYGLRISAFGCIVLTLSIVLAAFAEEIFWSGITSVDRGQWQAGRASGLGFTQVLVFIVLPQAIQMVIPPLTNKTINITKNTALASVISVSELLNQASSQQALFANPTPLTLAAILYVLVFMPFVFLSRYLESRFVVLK